MKERNDYIPGSGGEPRGPQRSAGGARFAWVVLVTAVVSLLMVTAVAWHVDLLGHEEEQRDCQRSVQARDDNRVMWLYALSTATDADPTELDTFRAELDRRLPALECRGEDPVPVEVKGNDG